MNGFSRRCRLALRALSLGLTSAALGCGGSGSTVATNAHGADARLRIVMGSPNANAITTAINPINNKISYSSLCPSTVPYGSPLLLQNGNAPAPTVAISLDGATFTAPLSYGQATNYRPVTAGIHELRITCGSKQLVLDQNLPPLNAGSFDTVVLAGRTPDVYLTSYDVNGVGFVVDPSTLRLVTFVDRDPQSFTAPTVSFYDAVPEASRPISVGSNIDGALGRFTSLGTVTYTDTNSAAAGNGSATTVLPSSAVNTQLLLYAGQGAVPFVVPSAPTTPVPPPTSPPLFPPPQPPTATSTPAPTPLPVGPGLPVGPVLADSNDLLDTLPFRNENHISVFIIDSPNAIELNGPAIGGALLTNAAATPPPTLTAVFP